MYLTEVKKIIKSNSQFYFAFLAVIIFSVIIQISFTKFQISLAVNSIHNSFLDYFLKYYTNLGDGFFALAILILILVFNRKYWLKAALCFYIPSLVAQFFKHFVFPENRRPVKLMADYIQLHYVTGELMNELNSFPSGHSTTAFAIATFFSLISRNKTTQFTLLFFAVLVAFSRVYLLQHFFEDVLAGALIGTTVSTFIFAAFKINDTKK